MKLVKSFALIFLTTVLIVGLQSCTVQQNAGLLGSKSSSQSAADAIVTSAPFAYDVVVDTISYNSCVGENLKSNRIHGLKIGVNEGFTDSTGKGAVKAGVKLRSDFLQYVGRNIFPKYPSTVITAEQIQYVLSNSPRNTDSFIQYAVRKKADLSVVVDLIQPPANAPFVLNRDGVSETESLKADTNLAQLTKDVVFGAGGAVLSEGPRVYNLRAKSAPPLPMEAEFGFSSSVDDTFKAVAGVEDGTGAGEQYSDIVRKKFNSNASDKYILAVTFGNPTASTAGADFGFGNPKRADVADKSAAYGRGFELKFDTASTKAGWRDNRLKSVNEIPLAKNDTLGVGSWACESFVIMKKEHWNNPKPTEAGCAPLTASDMQITIIAEQLKRVRRHYAEADWNVGLYYGKGASYVPATRGNQTLCLVPKTAQCYLQTESITADGVDVGIQYDPGQECYLSRYQVFGVSYTGGLTGDSARKLGRCAQYASICTRSSSTY